MQTPHCNLLSFIACIALLATARCSIWGRGSVECGKLDYYYDTLCKYIAMTRCARLTGGWQQRYSTHHASVLLGTAPQKYIVVGGPPDSGLADTLALVTSMLYVAVLTDRALLIKRDVSYTAAYDLPNINWSYNR